MISDPRRAQRRLDKLSSPERQTLRRAQRSTSSQDGRRLLRTRGQHIERSFAHVLDAGGMRRATLRGLENLHKRHQIAAACYNLSQLLRRLHGIGTPKQWRAFLGLLFAAPLLIIRSAWRSLITKIQDFRTALFPPLSLSMLKSVNRRSSTAC